MNTTYSIRLYMMLSIYFGIPSYYLYTIMTIIIQNEFEMK